jgi:hypothetical protein
MTISVLSANDVSRINGLQPVGWESIEEQFRFYVENPCCHPRKLEREGRIMAIGCTILFAETAWLAHIIVDPQFRCKGLGETMTRNLIAIAEASGRPSQYLIATQMGEPLYQRLGFVTSRSYSFYEAQPIAEPGILPGVRELSPDDRRAIHELDGLATGEDRSALLDSIELRGWVYENEEGGGISGVYLPDLGEGTVLATDIRGGIRLMKLRCRVGSKAPVLPTGNSAANECLKNWGFQLRNTAHRMVRNGEDPLNQEMIFNRIGGNLG